MAWTTPRTWVAGEIVRAATMNEHVRDNLVALRSEASTDRSDALADYPSMFNVLGYGATGDGVTDDKAAIRAAFQAAEDAGGSSIVYFPEGTYLVSGTLSLSGFSSVIRGAGCGNPTDTNSQGGVGGTIIKATAQTGPVVDLTGWRSPVNFYGAPEFRDFQIQGDGTADTTTGTLNKVKEGLRIKGVSQTAFRNIHIWNTGGPALSLKTESDLNTVENVVLGRPVDAHLNDVPYWLIEGVVVGNFFRNVGMRGLNSNTEGASGGLVIIHTADGTPAYNAFTDCWAEFLHLASGSQIIYQAGVWNVHTNWVFHDCDRINSAATDTSHFRLVAPTVDYGGNRIVGIIPGDGGNAVTAGTRYTINRGVRTSQSRNVIEGVKGDNGNNVELLAGVRWTYACLSGAASGDSDGLTSAFIDNSGQYDNILIDNERQTWTVGGSTEIGYGASIGAGWKVKHTAGVGNPTLMLVNSAGKQYELRVDETTNELRVDYWNGASRALDVLKLNVDGSLTVASGLTFGSSAGVRSLEVGAVDSAGAGYRTVRVAN